MMAIAVNTLSSLLGLVFMFIGIILTKYFIQWLKVKIENLKISNDKNLQDKYLNLLQETITNCVIATNQTYVSSLKQQGNFTMEAQKEAFQQTYNAIMAILDNDAKKYLNEITGDLSKYLTTQIEATVNKNKN